MKRKKKASARARTAPARKVRNDTGVKKRRNLDGVANLEALAAGFEQRVDALVAASTLKDEGSKRVLAEQIERARLHEATLIRSMLSRGDLSADEHRALQGLRSSVLRMLNKLGVLSYGKEEGASLASQYLDEGGR